MWKKRDKTLKKKWKQILGNQYEIVEFNFMGQKSDNNIISLIYYSLVRSSRTNTVNKIPCWFCIADLKWCLGNNGSKSIWVPYTVLV